MPTNWKKLYAMKKKAETELLKNNPSINNRSGIYMLLRTDENGIKFAYIGQAKHMLDRLVSHMIGYSQRIDISLRKRGLYSAKNKYGWDLHFYEFDESELNEKEKTYITFYIKMGYQMYNKTLGSQGEGKVSIDDHSTKGYFDGVKYGYQKAIKEVAEYFEKYLDYDIKPTLVKKDGTRTAISLKKYDEFAQLLKGDKENE